MKIAALLVLSLLVGCTNQSTKLAIQNYQTAEEHKQLSFNNAYRTASEQMLLNLVQYTEANSNNPAVIKQAIVMTWLARAELEESRMQYLYGRVLTMVTVGQYLYDKQGVLNVWFEDKATILNETSKAVDTANEAAGIESVKDLFPPVDDITQPTADDEFQKVFEELKGSDETNE